MSHAYRCRSPRPRRQRHGDALRDSTYHTAAFGARMTRRGVRVRRAHVPAIAADCARVVTPRGPTGDQPTRGDSPATAERSEAIAISHTHIDSLKSFVATTAEPHQVAGLYFFSALDCLVDSAHRVAHDFLNRPHLYTDLTPAKPPPSSIASLLAALHARYGSDERLLAGDQRHQVYSALFGPLAGLGTTNDSDFARLRNGLVNACAAFAERVYDTGVGMLRDRVRSAHRPFHEYLTGLLGDSVRWSRDSAFAELTEGFVYPILRNKGVGAVFGVSTPPTQEWPYVEDSNGDKLLEEIHRQLRGRAPTTPTIVFSPPVLTRERISNLQRVALRGAEALNTTIDFDERGSDADLDQLITRCYTWGSALASVATPVMTVEPSSTIEPAPIGHNQPEPATEAAVLAPRSLP